MALPTSYLTSAKRFPAILEAIKTAQAPEVFGQKFLESLDFKSKGDRLSIGVLKALGFLDDGGRPQDRYYRFLDQSHSGAVLAEAIKDAYADLFAVNINAHTLTREDLTGKIRTLSQGKLSDNVVKFMVTTFTALVGQADFSAPTPLPIEPKEDTEEGQEKPPEKPAIGDRPPTQLGGLVYNIQIVLPETRDTAVYDALFRSLKEHML